MLKSPDGRYVFGLVKVGEKGQIVIPKSARDVFGIKPGDSLMLLGDPETGLAALTSESLKQFFGGVLEKEGDSKNDGD